MGGKKSRRMIRFARPGHISPVRSDGKPSSLASSSDSSAARLPLRLLGEGGLPQRVPRPVAEPPVQARLAAHHRGGLVFLAPHEVWAFEASAGSTFVHSSHGRFNIDFSLVEMEESFCRPLTRVHRNWLVDLSHVRAFEREPSGARLLVGAGMDESQCVRVPVSRDLAHAIRGRLLADATGVRQTPSSRD